MQEKYPFLAHKEEERNLMLRSMGLGSINELFKDIKKDNSSRKTILFSPAAASFDNFKNFEDRGQYFNKMIKKYTYAR